MRLRFGCRTTSRREGEHTNDAHARAKRQRDDLPGGDPFMTILHRSPIDTDMARRDDRLGKRAGFGQTDEKKKFVEPHQPDVTKA